MAICCRCSRTSCWYCLVYTKLYKLQKLLSLTNHGYTPLIVVMNKAKFDALSPALQTALVRAAQEAGAYQRQLNLRNEKSIIEKMQKAGVEIIERVDTGPFREAIENRSTQGIH